MRVREFLERLNQYDSVTFVIQETAERKAPMYGKKSVYWTTPIRTVDEWLAGGSIDKYIVINSNVPPIDVTGSWTRDYNKGRLKCCMITTEEELILRYGEKQGREMVDWYNETVK